jgi:transposase
VNKEVYIDTLRRLRYEVRRRRPEKWGTNSWFVLYDNGAAHQSFLVKDFLAKNNLTTLENPPHSSDLAPADFFFCSLE